MNRREWMCAGMAAVCHGIASRDQALGAAATEGLDQYGGWTGRKFDSTGFFRVEKDERWWLVTPDGNAFLSFGINHLHPDW